MNPRLPADRRQFLGYTSLGAVGAIGAVGSIGAVGTLDTAPVRADPLAEGAGEHELPDLPYAYDALEPHVDAKTMRLHHQNHHGGALRGLNRTEKALAEAAKKSDFDAAKALCRALAYYGSSHVLHSTFWTNMQPKGGGDPKGALAARLKADFGGIDNFRGMFLAATNSAPASGWGLLGYHPALDRMLVLQVEDHEKLTLFGVVPLLVCDVWEHAYYLKYQNRRQEWTAAFMQSLVNWDDVARRFDTARSQTTARGEKR